jgi:flagellar M-ring protein FliF
MSTLDDIRDRVQQALSQFSTGQKIGIALVALLTFGALIWIVTSASEPSYRTLYADLDEATASKIVQELDNQQIPYELNGPGAVAVPQDQLYRARLHLAGLGLPSGDGKGYELFDDAEFGMTAFTQKVNYQRALEHELGQTIGAMQPIQSARVHLVLPERSLFKDEQRQPSASVAVDLETGQRPNAGQIQSIRYLVSSAIESLEPGRVTIVDSTGELLARPDRDGGVANADESLEAATKLESSLEDRIVELLAPVVGRENLRARVRAELDTSTSTRTDERYDPETRAIRSEQRSTRKEALDGETVGGAPGIASNLPGREAEQIAEEQNLAKSQLQETINYEVSRTVTQTTKNGYDVERLSVAVVLNEDLLDASQGEGQGQDSREIDRERIAALVSSAVGIQTDRGDQVEITWESFMDTPSAPTEPAPFYLRPEVYVPVAKYAFLVLLTLLLLLFVVRPLVKAITSAGASDAAEVDELLAADAGDDESLAVVGRTVAEAEEQLGGAESEIELVEEPERQSPYFRLREEVIELGSSDLDRTGDILRQWIRMNDEDVVEVERES